jgi:positive regulator of sigma E activity
MKIIPSLIFFIVFYIPLVAFLGWLMLQDKLNKKKGIIVLAVIAIGGVAYMFWKTKGQ